MNNKKEAFFELEDPFYFYRVRFQPKLEEPLIQIQFWFQPFHGLKCANSASAVKKGSDSSSPKTPGSKAKMFFFYIFFCSPPKIQEEIDKEFNSFSQWADAALIKVSPHTGRVIFILYQTGMNWWKKSRQEQTVHRSKVIDK